MGGIMRRGKKTRTIGDISISKLLDDFVDLDVVDDTLRTTGMTDEEYITLMLKKEARKRLDRFRKEPDIVTTDEEDTNNNIIKEVFEKCTSCFYCARIIKVGESVLCACTNSQRELEARYFDFKWWVSCQNHVGCWKSNPNRDFDAILRRRIELRLEVGQKEIEKEVKTDDANLPRPTIEIIETSSDVLEPEIPTPETEAAVKFLRDEITTSSSKREALQTLQKYRKAALVKREKKPDTPVVSEESSLVKRCQNCYFCAAERIIGGSCWCHCTNVGRSTTESSGKPWVKSRLNLPCWKTTQV
jgi:hypothetical protein